MQPFNGCPHHDLKNLNLHTTIHPPFRNKGSLTRWQQELRLVKEYQPEPSINQSGAFLSNGAGQMRWTSSRPP